MEVQMEAGALHSITVSATDVIWIKKGKEIIIEGRMFDIKTFSYKGNNYDFTGLFDDEESILMKQMEENENSSRDNKKIAQLIQLLQIVYKDLNDINDISVLSLNNKFILDKENTLPLRFIPIITPPPQA